MSEIEALEKVIKGAFKSWCDKFLMKSVNEGGAGFNDFLDQDRAKAEVVRVADPKLRRNIVSTILMTEADIQMQFGSYLHQHLQANKITSSTRHTVHLEMKCFNERLSRADLIVVEINENEHSRASTQTVLDSIRAIIEIKAQGLVKPYGEGTFESLLSNDIRKLDSLKDSILPDKVLRFLLVLDEDRNIGRTRQQVVERLISEHPHVIPLVPTWSPPTSTT